MMLEPASRLPSPASRLPGGRRRRTDARRAHDLDAGVVVPQDHVERGARERHSEGSVLAEADAVAPAAAEKQELDLPLRSPRLLHGEEEVGKLEGLPHVE